jgi:hypothetical protein
MTAALIIVILAALPAGAMLVSWHMSGLSRSAWLATWLWVEDPYNELSRFDRLDGLGDDRDADL